MISKCQIRFEQCATFHILTPYPATPLFARMKAEGRLFHCDWSLDDTAHAVFRPKRMTPDDDCGIQVNGSFVLGFDYDDKDVFQRTADWVEENRLE